MKKITICGSGSWGTAIACLLGKNHRVTLWGRSGDLLEKIKREEENSRYLPGVSLPGVEIEGDLKRACSGRNVLILAIPTQSLRSFLKALSPHVTKDHLLICASKGLEIETNKLSSEIAEECLPNHRAIAILSGPSHAEEVARGIPTAVTAASQDESVALAVQELFASESFRVYVSLDIKGVEIAGAVKNIIAVAAGIVDGLGFGSNTVAALATRGVVEITRFGETMGGDPRTFYGLAGVGDLIATCISSHSRNRRLGQLVAQGRTPEQAQIEIGQTAEGMPTTKAVYTYSHVHKLSMPICTEVYRVLFEGKAPREAASALMSREPRLEVE